MEWEIGNLEGGKGSGEFRIWNGEGGTLVFTSAIKKFQITKHKYQTNHNDRNSKSQRIEY
jgi:hypothetical protein